jgi:hypothetical protein
MIGLPIYLNGYMEPKSYLTICDNKVIVTNPKNKIKVISNEAPLSIHKLISGYYVLFINTKYLKAVMLLNNKFKGNLPDYILGKGNRYKVDNIDQFNPEYEVKYANKFNVITDDNLKNTIIKVLTKVVSSKVITFAEGREELIELLDTLNSK